MILVVGGLGSIGSRYVAILKSLRIDYDIYDYHTGVLSTMEGETDLAKVKFEKAIICTPTETHVKYCRLFEILGKPYLCEKPLTKDLEDAKGLEKFVHGYMVCNYKILMDAFSRDAHIHYDYFRTGKDGLLWDCCQLLYLDPLATLNNESPVFRLHLHSPWDEYDCYGEIPYALVERAYVSMILKFVNGEYSDLWTLEDGVAMTEEVLRRIKSESTCRNPGPLHVN